MWQRRGAFVTLGAAGALRGCVGHVRPDRPLADVVRVAPALPERIVIGRDGLLVRRGAASALLLPQVAPEYHWEPRAFLSATCRKAGLSADAWREPGTQVFTFQAEVFSEIRDGGDGMREA